MNSDYNKTFPNTQTKFMLPRITLDDKVENFPTINLKKAATKSILALGAPLLKKFIASPAEFDFELVDFKQYSAPNSEEKKDEFSIGTGVILSTQAKIIKKGQKLGEYQGEISTHNQIALKYPDEKEEDIHAYAFSIEGETVNKNKRCVFAHAEGNFLRFINHNASDPNVNARVYNGVISLFAARDIYPGEQLTYNYGKVYASHKMYYIPSMLNYLHPMNFLQENKDFYDLERPLKLTDQMKFILQIEADFVVLPLTISKLFNNETITPAALDYIKRLPIIELMHDTIEHTLHVLTKQHHNAPIHFAAVYNPEILPALLDLNIDLLAKTRNNLDVFILLLKISSTQKTFVKNALPLLAKLQQIKPSHITLGDDGDYSILEHLLQKNWTTALTHFAHPLFSKMIIADELDIAHYLLRKQKFNLLIQLMHTKFSTYILFSLKKLSFIYDEFMQKNCYETHKNELSKVTLLILKHAKNQNIKKIPLINTIVQDTTEIETLPQKTSSTGRHVKVNKRYVTDMESKTVSSASRSKRSKRLVTENEPRDLEPKKKRKKATGNITLKSKPLKKSKIKSKKSFSHDHDQFIELFKSAAFSKKYHSFYDTFTNFHKPITSDCIIHLIYNGIFNDLFEKKLDMTTIMSKGILNKERLLKYFTRWGTKKLRYIFPCLQTFPAASLSENMTVLKELEELVFKKIGNPKIKKAHLKKSDSDTSDKPGLEKKVEVFQDGFFNLPSLPPLPLSTLEQPITPEIKEGNVPPVDCSCIPWTLNFADIVDPLRTLPLAENIYLKSSAITFFAPPPMPQPMEVVQTTSSLNNLSSTLTGAKDER